MSRKDYTAIADSLRELRKTSPLPDGWDRIINQVVKVFREDNPRFDTERFWNYIER